MTNRAVKLAPHIVAGLLASAAVTAVQLNAAIAADDCLAKPAGGTAGQHWYYHLDHATKRQCWYLRDGATTSTAASQTVSGSRQAAATKRNDTSLSSSTANARAELQASDPSPGDDAKSASTAAVTDPGAAIPSAMNTGGSAVSQSSIAARWPDQTDAQLPVNALTQRPPAAAAQAAPMDNAMAVADATPTPAKPTDASPISEADASAAQVAAVATEGPSRTLLLACLSALAFAGFSISVIWARIKARRQIRLESGQRRGPRWPDDVEDESMLPPWQQPTARDLDYPRAPARDSRRPRRQWADADPVTATPAAPRNNLSEIEELLSHYAGQHGNG